MRLALLVALAVLGVALIAAGVAAIYWPASLIFVGAVSLLLAFAVEVRDA